MQLPQQHLPQTQKNEDMASKLLSNLQYMIILKKYYVSNSKSQKTSMLTVQEALNIYNMDIQVPNILKSVRQQHKQNE